MHVLATELASLEEVETAIDLAQIYVMVGDHERAVEQLEYLLTNPSWVSVAWLEIDPTWNPLRDDPAFQELLERHRDKAD